MNAIFALHAGGTLNPRKHVYIERPADDRLFALLREGRYVNVLSSRQMGKSSLVMRTAHRLKAEGVRVIYIDLASEIGVAESADAYYLGLLNKMNRDLKLAQPLEPWWNSLVAETANQRLLRFFRELVANAVTGSLVIFLDEIDSTLKFPFTDGLFTAIRGMYNERGLVQAYERTTFCLVGVATPNELIKDRRTTPYNVGETLELGDFDPRRDNLTPLERALSADPATGRNLLDRTLSWTGGHPYLTVKLVTELRAAGIAAPQEVDWFVEAAYGTLGQAQTDAHFQQILRFLETRLSTGLVAFQLYRRVFEGKREQDLQTLAHAELKLSGLVKRGPEGYLVVRCRIYRRLFDRRWLAGIAPVRAVVHYRRLAIAASVLLLIGTTGVTYYQLAIVEPELRTLRNEIEAAHEPLSVLVAKLNHDANDTVGNQIFGVLRELPGIQALHLERTIPTDSRMTEAVGADPGEVARRYLRESGASVLIWGSVLDRKNNIAELFLTTSSSITDKLFLMTSSSNKEKGEEDKQQQLEIIGTTAAIPSASTASSETLRLPEVFWSDLAPVLRLAIVSRYAKLRALANEGKYVADQLTPFIASVRRLLNESRNQPGWTDARGSTLVILADALQTIGARESGTARFEEAVAACHEALQELTRERVPLQWAETQTSLGNALQALGERERGTKRLEEAVDAYRAALQERTRERVPLQWAATQNNLGNALSEIGDRESGTKRLEEAVEVFQEALQERTRERVPLDWAVTQNNLGLVLFEIGERERGTEHLEEAVAAYRAALQELTRERVPLDWARAQNGLGNALNAIGERESGTARLEEAVAMFRAALLEWTRERVPLGWAATQNNLGNALRALGERESGTARLEEAVEAYRAALQELTRERVPLRWAAIQNNLGNALQALGERERGTEHLEEAVVVFRAALQERTRERVPLDWAVTQNNLGLVLFEIGERERGTEHLEEAVAAYRAALAVFLPGQASFYADKAKTNLARAESLLRTRQEGAGGPQ